MKKLPIRRSAFDLQGFVAWLANAGAEVGVPTNPYEVVRYRAYHKGSKRPLTHIVYAKESGLLNFQGGSGDHYLAFLERRVPRGMFVSQFDPPSLAKTELGTGAKMRAKIIERDGSSCWYCGVEMGDDCTLEHLVPKSKGGSNSAANFALAHAECNRMAADMPLVDKIALRTKLRTEDMEI